MPCCDPQARAATTSDKVHGDRLHTAQAAHAVQNPGQALTAGQTEHPVRLRGHAPHLHNTQGICPAPENQADMREAFPNGGVLMKTFAQRAGLRRRSSAKGTALPMGITASPAATSSWPTRSLLCIFR